MRTISGFRILYTDAWCVILSVLTIFCLLAFWLIIPLFIAGLCIYLAYRRCKAIYKVLAEGVAVPAVILDRHYRKSTWTFSFRYQYNQIGYESRNTVYRFWTTLRAGDSVQVFLHPDRPEQAFLSKFFVDVADDDPVSLERRPAETNSYPSGDERNWGAESPAPNGANVYPASTSSQQVDRQNRPRKKKLSTVALIFLLLLSIPAGLLTLLGIAFAAIEKQPLPLLIFLVASLLVFPGLQGVFKRRLPLLGFPFLNMFLSVVLMLAGMMTLGGLVGDQVSTTKNPSIVFNDIRLCNRLAEERCDGDDNAFVRNTPTLFITGTVEKMATESATTKNPAAENDATENATTENTTTEGAIAEGAVIEEAETALENASESVEVTLTVNYTPKPGKTETLATETLAIPLEVGMLKWVYSPPELPVGAYELVLDSESKAFEPVSKTFSVWPDADWVSAIANQTKPKVDTELEGLKLCVDPDPEKKGDFCPNDETLFTSDVTDLKAEADLEDAKDGVQLTFLWFDLSNSEPKEIHRNTVDLELGHSWFSMTLRGDYPPGEYEVVVMLEASNREPLRHRFTIEKAQ